VTTRAFSQTLSLTVGPSRQLWLLIVVAHLVAILSLLLIDIPQTWRWAGWAIILVHAVHVWRDSQWLRDLRQVHYADGDFYLSFDTHCFDNKRSGSDRIPALPDGGHIATPWLVILSLKVSGKRRHLPIFPDACNADELRRLRVLLRCGAGAVHHS